jgi:hypothetical protein
VLDERHADMRLHQSFVVGLNNFGNTHYFLDSNFCFLVKELGGYRVDVVGCVCVGYVFIVNFLSLN